MEIVIMEINIMEMDMHIMEQVCTDMGMKYIHGQLVLLHIYLHIVMRRPIPELAPFTSKE